MTPKTRVLLAYNLNLDAMIQMKTQAQYETVCKHLETYDPHLLDIFQNAVSSASAREELVSKEFMEAMLASFEYELALGGQEGFFFRTASAHFHDTYEAVLHFPSRAVQFINFLKEVNPDALVYETDPTDPSKTSLVPLTEARSVPEHGAPVHVILEYASEIKLSRYKTGEEMTPWRSNRFILTYDPIQATLELDPAFVAGQAESQPAPVALISGYHLLKGGVLTPEWRASHLQSMRRISSGTSPKPFVHYELASTNDTEILGFVLKNLFRVGADTPLEMGVSSIGLNEQELDTIGLWGRDHAAWAEWSADDSYLTKVAKFLAYVDGSIHTIFFHAPGFYLAMSDGPKAGLEEGAMALPADNIMKGFKRAENVIITERSLPDSVKISLDLPEALVRDLPSDGSTAGTVSVLGRTFSYIYYRPKMIKPISGTVGLGDTISSSIVLGSLEAL